MVKCMSRFASIPTHAKASPCVSSEMNRASSHVIPHARFSKTDIQQRNPHEYNQLLDVSVNFHFELFLNQ